MHPRHIGDGALVPAIDSARRQSLYAAKLRALVGENFAESPAQNYLRGKTYGPAYEGHCKNESSSAPGSEADSGPTAGATGDAGTAEADDGADAGPTGDAGTAEAGAGADAGATGDAGTAEADDGADAGATGDAGTAEAGAGADAGPRGTSAVGGTFPGGAVLRRGSTGWVLAEERPERALGGALVWATRSHIGELHVLAEGDEPAGVLARRAAAFRRPPQVWTISGRTVTPAVAAPPLADEAPTDADLRFAAMFAAAGADAVVEHGVLVAEVLGLEVGRVIDGRLDVGVGKHDREAQRLVHGDRPPEEALRAAVAAVREVRRAGAPVHEMNRLAQERWLRSVVMANPQMVGAASLAPLPEPVSRHGLRMATPAPAAGTDAEGRPLVVVCSTGIDVDLVPTAADARLAHDATARLIIVVPEADDHPVTRDLAASLADPADVVAVTGDWRDLPVPASR